MIKISSLYCLFFLLPLTIFSQSIGQTQSTLDYYRKSASLRILNDIQYLGQSGELNKIRPYMSDLVSMINSFNEPIQRKYDSSVKYQTKADYIDDMVKSFKTSEAQIQAEMFASLLYFGRLEQYKTQMNQQLTRLKTNYIYSTVLDNIVAIQAAAGQSETATKQLTKFEASIPADRAYMHLAVKEALNMEFDSAYAKADKSLSKIDPTYPNFETLRQFFRLLELFGEHNRKHLAKQLIGKCPKEGNQIVALAYLAKGLNNKDLLDEAIQLANQMEEDRNYPLKEIGILATKMKAMDLAEHCANLMDTKSLNQNPIYLLTEMAKTTKDKLFFRMAISKVSDIPVRAVSEYADAMIWITLAAIELEMDEGEIVQMLYLINRLKPEYRIKFHLRILNIESPRYYMANN